MFNTGVPACTVQPSFQGIAISTGGTNALIFDAVRPDGLTFFDGNVKYKLENISGDAWLAFGLDISVPQLLPVPGSNLICFPGGSQAKPDKPPGAPFNVALAGSLFIKNDLDNEDDDGELLILGVVDEIHIKFKGVVDIDLGTMNAALRIRASNPACFPSGIFFSALISPVATFGPKVSPFLSFDKKSNDKIDIFGGVTWLDRGNVKPEEYIQSFFYQETRDMVYLGITFNSVLDFQYFDDNEFSRRQAFDPDVCCPPGGEFTNCAIADTGIAKIINSGKEFEVKPTFGIFAQLKDMDFYGSKFVLQLYHVNHICGTNTFTAVFYQQLFLSKR